MCVRGGLTTCWTPACLASCHRFNDCGAKLHLSAKPEIMALKTMCAAQNGGSDAGGPVGSR